MVALIRVLYHFISWSPSHKRMCVQSEDSSPHSTRISSPSLPKKSVVSDANSQKSMGILDRELESRPAVEQLAVRQSFQDDERFPGVRMPLTYVPGRHELQLQTAEVVQFCVADVRKRLNDHLGTPKKLFHRDPEDPSG